MKLLDDNEIVLQKGRVKDNLLGVANFFFTIAILVVINYLVYFFGGYEYDFIPETSIEFIQKLHIPVKEMYFIAAFALAFILCLIFVLIYHVINKSNYLIVTNKNIYISPSQKGQDIMTLQEIDSVTLEKNVIHINKGEDVYKIKHISSPNPICLILNDQIVKAKNPEVTLITKKLELLEQSKF